MTNFSEDDLRVGLFYVLKYNTGYVDALGEVNSQLPEYFRGIGYISFGIDAQANRRYKITDFGRRQAISVYTALCRRKRMDELKNQELLSVSE